MQRALRLLSAQQQTLDMQIWNKSKGVFKATGTTQAQCADVGSSLFRYNQYCLGCKQLQH